MKKLCLIISIILCVVLLFNSIAAFADTEDDVILTLEEAKALALKNDIQFNSQERYIQQAKENYDEVYDNNTKSVSSKGDIAAKAAAEVSQDAAIENAAFSVNKAILNGDDLKRTSDFDVTEAFYGVIKAKYSLENAEAEMKLKKNGLETARIKYGLSIITKESFSQTEIAYAASQTAYNSAFSELQNSMSQLNKSIGKDLDELNYQLDMTLSVPDIKSLDLNKIKEDNLKNNSSYYSLKEQYKLAEHKLLLTQELYEYYYEKFKSNSTVRDKFEDMLYEAQRNFDDAEYNYNEKLYDLDTTLSNQFTSINNLYESYMNQKEEFEAARLAAEENKIKYQMGLLSKSALDSSEANLNKLENQLNTTIMNLNTQYLNITQYSKE